MFVVMTLFIERHMTSSHMTNTYAKFSLRFSVIIHLVSNDNKYINNSSVHYYLFCKFHFSSFVCVLGSVIQTYANTRDVCLFGVLNVCCT